MLIKHIVGETHTYDNFRLSISDSLEFQLNRLEYFEKIIKDRTDVRSEFGSVSIDLDTMIVKYTPNPYHEKDVIWIQIEFNNRAQKTYMVDIEVYDSIIEPSKSGDGSSDNTDSSDSGDGSSDNTDSSDSSNSGDGSSDEDEQPSCGIDLTAEYILKDIDTITAFGMAENGCVADGDTLILSVNGNEYVTTISSNEWEVDVLIEDLLIDKLMVIELESTDLNGDTIKTPAELAYTIIAVESIPEPSSGGEAKCESGDEEVTINCIVESIGDGIIAISGTAGLKEDGVFSCIKDDDLVEVNVNDVIYEGFVFENEWVVNVESRDALSKPLVKVTVTSKDECDEIIVTSAEIEFPTENLKTGYVDKDILSVEQVSAAIAGGNVPPPAPPPPPPAAS